MKPLRDLMARRRSCLRIRNGALSLGWVLVCLTSLPSTAWSQCAGLGPIICDGDKVGIGTTSPTERLDIGSLSTLADTYLKISNGDQNTFVSGIKLRGSADSYGFTMKLENDGTGGARLNFVRHSASTTGVSALTIHRDTGNVGIETSVPGAKLDIHPPVGADMKFLQLYQTKNNGGSSDVAYIQDDRGFSGANTGNALKILGWNAGGDDTGNILHLDSFNGTHYPVFVAKLNGNVGIGTSSPQYKLAVNGKIGATEVIVTTTGWSDYVFEASYKLRPLKEVATYIQANHHLPDIPSKTEVQQNGISVGEMQAKLLAKIEELTLHMIQAEQRNDRLEQEIRQLRSKSTPGVEPSAPQDGANPQKEIRNGQ